MRSFQNSRYVLKLQVFDLAVEKPEQILQKLLDHIEKLQDNGDKVAKYIREHLRVIVSFFYHSNCIMILCDLHIVSTSTSEYLWKKK